MNTSLTHTLNNLSLCVSLLISSTNLEANVRHPRGPEGNEWSMKTFQILGPERGFTLSFIAPNGNDPRISDKLISEIDMDDPRFTEDNPSSPVTINWSWGHDWFWQDYHGFLSLNVQICSWKNSNKYNQDIEFENFILQKISSHKKQNIIQNSVHYVFDDKISRIKINDLEWVLYNTIRFPSVVNLPNERYALPLDNKHYLLIYFNYIDQTSSPKIESDWIPRAKAMVTKIINSVKIKPILASRP